jgi:cell wall-associated NlpC family hydrolase
MPIQRLTGIAALFSVLLFTAPVHAANRVAAPAASTDTAAAAPVFPQNALDLRSAPASSRTLDFTAGLSSFAAGKLAPVSLAAPAAAEPADADADADATASPAESLTDLRKSLLALAMHLRDVRYVRGGRNPDTGFDCSGFVRYVFAHAIGVQLPANSASQFLAGLKVKRTDMKPGDLVFFHTGGRRRGITHVGIYIADGRFIHAPASGKTVQVSSLDEAYWAKRFVGAKRPEGMLVLAGHSG